MNIVFDNIVFSLQRAGGISAVWQELLSRFISLQKDDLSFIEHLTDKNNSFRKKLDFSRGKIIKKRTRWFTLERYINPRLTIKQPFIFHSSYFRTCPNKNAINVTTVHDFTYDFFYKGKRFGAFLHLWQRNNAIKKADAIVCISDNTRKDLLHFLPNTDPNKIHVIYNGVSDDYHVTDKKIDKYSDYILFVGARIAYKNGKWLAETIKGKGIKIVFCGQPMQNKEKEYYDSVLGKGNYEMIVFPTNEELNQIYNSVKCLVYPSSYEGFGIPVLEAQKAGCPVIALQASSIPEIIGETPLLMKRLTKEELMEKLELLDNPVVRNSIIVNGIENAKRFTWDRAFTQYRGLYEKLMSERV